MTIDLPEVLRQALAPEQSFLPGQVWIGEHDMRPARGFTHGDDGLWSFWRLGPRLVTYAWSGAIADQASIERSLVFSASIELRRLLRPEGAPIVPFYLVDRDYLVQAAEGGPSIDGFEAGSVEYGDHGEVPAAYRDGELFSVGGCALPSMLRASTFPVEQFYEELASPEGGEIFMINPHTSRGA